VGRPRAPTDRFGRGGDHIEFLNLGFPAARLTVAIENYDWEHQDVRTEKGKHYGDTVDHMDFVYLTKVAKLNIAALAAIASAPPPPEPKVQGAVSTDTTVSWRGVSNAVAYKVWWRRTDANNWQTARSVLDQNAFEKRPNDPTCHMTVNEPPWTECEIVLPHIRVDDWVFGVSSVSKDGFESPVASAVPGGAFKPYVAPPKDEKKP
jgi:hypothetical protein